MSIDRVPFGQCPICLNQDVALIPNVRDAAGMKLSACIKCAGDPRLGLEPTYRMYVYAARNRPYFAASDIRRLRRYMIMFDGSGPIVPHKVACTCKINVETGRTDVTGCPRHDLHQARKGELQDRPQAK